MCYIEACLNRLDSLEPIIPENCPEEQIFACPDIKLVIFDIYGTLMISGSGDIHQQLLNPENILQAFQECDIKITSRTPHLTARLAVSEYLRRIDIFRHAALVEGKEHPEVNILQIWDTVLETLSSTKSIDLKFPVNLRQLAFTAESLFNPVYPMPGMKEVLKTLEERNIPKGIISNAQFYTPIIMNYFLTGKVTEADKVEGFENDLSVFSYQHLRAKPDLELFKTIKQNLDKYSVEPEQTLFVGNDMLNDIYPARISGFKTALFAGDSRSLRLREEYSDLEGIKPDFIITELKQLLEIVTHENI